MSFLALDYTEVTDVQYLDTLKAMRKSYDYVHSAGPHLLRLASFSVELCVNLSVCCPSMYLSVCAFVYLSVRLAAHLAMCLCVCVCLCAYLSVYVLCEFVWSVEPLNDYYESTYSCFATTLQLN